MRHGLFQRLGRDRRGVSAVEFALIAPIMIALYFGLAEFCQGFMAQKRMGHVSATVADLVAQNASIETGTVEDIFTIGALVMRPFPAETALKQRVTSVTRDSRGIVKVDWSIGDGMTARGKDSDVDVPAGLIANGESLVMTEVTYDFDSPVDYMLPGITTFSHTYYLRPRVSDVVRLTN